MRWSYLLMLLILRWAVQAQVENTAWGSFATYQSMNGMVYTVSSASRFQPAEVHIHVRSGAVYDRKYQTGISSLVGEIISSRINDKLATGKFPNFRFTYSQSPEHSLFKFKTPNSELSSLLGFIYKEFCNQKITQEEIDRFVNVLNEKRSTDSIDEKSKYKHVLNQRLFKFDTQKINVFGEAEDLRLLSLLDVDSFYRMNYVPNNATVVVYANAGLQQQAAMVEQALNGWVKTDFNPDELTKIRTFKPLIYSTQDVLLNSPADSKITIAALTNGTRSYLRSTYFNFLLSAMLNDTSQQFYKILQEDIHPKSVLAEFDLKNFYGVFKISVQPADGEFADTYDKLRKLITRMHEFIDDSTVAKSKRKFAEEYAAFKNSPEFVNTSVRYFFTNSQSYMFSLNDSVQQLRTKEFLRYVYTHYCVNPKAAILETDSAHFVDENVPAWFDDVDETIGNQAFTYRKNIPDLEGEANATLLRKLVQYLNINPDVDCQINGIADRREYNRFSDASVFEFIDTIETFKKYKPDFVKKRTIRLELMRAFKVVKLLADNNIAFERIKGTAMSYHSKTDEEFALNRRTTITLNRLRQRLPLRNDRIFGK